jgi:hypothetical protein
MRRAAKVDRNQAEIVKAFRQIGAKVQVLSAVGKGCPDLLVGFRGVNVLVEVKDGEKVASARTLTVDQKNWHDSWPGQVCIAEDIQDAVNKVVRIAMGAAA